MYKISTLHSKGLFFFLSGSYKMAVLWNQFPCQVSWVPWFISELKNWKQMVTTKSQKWNQSHTGILASLLGNCQQQSIHWRYHDWFLDQDRYLSGLLKCKKFVNPVFIKSGFFLESQEFPLKSGFLNFFFIVHLWLRCGLRQDQDP